MSTRNFTGIVLDWFSQIARFVLGVVFLASGILKILSPNDAATLVNAMTGLSAQLSIVAVYLGSGSEVVLGLLLLFRISGKSVPVIVSFALMLFTLAVVSLAESGQSCGCFGSLWESSIDEIFFLRNTSLLVVALYLVWYGNRFEERGTR